MKRLVLLLLTLSCCTTVACSSQRQILQYDYHEVTFKQQYQGRTYDRKIYLYVPDQIANLDKAYPLVYVSHGNATSAPIIARSSGFHALASRLNPDETFIVAYTQGLPRGKKFWWSGRNSPDIHLEYLKQSLGEIEDYLISQNGISVQIDRSNIFGVGSSGGAAITILLNNNNDEFDFAAIAPISNGQRITVSDVPVIKMHSVEDEVIVYSRARWSLRELVAMYQTPVVHEQEEAVLGANDTRAVIDTYYSEVVPDQRNVFYSLYVNGPNGGHSYAFNLGADEDGVATVTEIIWDFFKRYTMD